MFNDMTRQKKFLGVWVSPAGYERVKHLADRETDGNVSAMVRRLLGEAMDARTRRGPA